MRIALGSDHVGRALKMELAGRLVTGGHEVEDIGAHDDTSCDYPIHGATAARLVARGGRTVQS